MIVPRVISGSSHVTVSFSGPGVKDTSWGASGVGLCPYTVISHESSGPDLLLSNLSVIRSVQVPSGSSPRCFADPKRIGPDSDIASSDS